MQLDDDNVVCVLAPLHHHLIDLAELVVDIRMVLSKLARKRRLVCSKLGRCWCLTIFSMPICCDEEVEERSHLAYCLTF